MEGPHGHTRSERDVILCPLYRRETEAQGGPVHAQAHPDVSNEARTVSRQLSVPQTNAFAFVLWWTSKL